MTITQQPADAEALAAAALAWLLGAARDTGTDSGTDSGTGLAWTTRPSDDELNPTLYSGTSGVVTALLEGWRHFGDDRYADAALRGARSIAAAVDGWEHSSLYLGLSGMAFALHAVHDLLGDAAPEPQPRAPWITSAHASTGRAGASSSSCSAATPASSASCSASPA